MTAPCALPGLLWKLFESCCHSKSSAETIRWQGRLLWQVLGAGSILFCMDLARQDVDTVVFH